MTQAHAHDIEDVFNPSLRPNGVDDKELFIEKQKFAMAVLVHSIQTDIGCTFIHEHHHDFDAQECWRKITDEAHKSTRAELEVTALQDNIMQARIDSNWHGTVLDFSSPFDQLAMHSLQAKDADQKPKAAPDPNSLSIPYAWKQWPPGIQVLFCKACDKQSFGSIKPRAVKFHVMYAVTSSDDLAPDIEQVHKLTSDNVVLSDEEALVSGEHNLQLSYLDGDDLNVLQVIQSRVHSKGEQSQGEPTRMPTISPDELLGRSVLLPPNEDGEHFHPKIVHKIIDHEKDILDQPEMIQFLVNVGSEQAEEIHAYTDLVDYINQEEMEHETGENFSILKISLHTKDL